MKPIKLDTVDEWVDLRGAIKWAVRLAKKSASGYRKGSTYRKFIANDLRIFKKLYRNLDF